MAVSTLVADTRTPATPATVRRMRRPGSRWELAVLLVPALTLFILFVLVAIGVAVYYSFFDWNGFGPLNHVVGFANYLKALADPVFQGAIWHNVVFAVLSIVIQLPLCLGLALLLNGRLRGRAALRLIAFTPYVVSEAITAVIWLSLLQPDGVVDQVLRAAGLGGLVHDWLADQNLVLYTLFVVITWKYIGFGIILFLAGLQGVPPDLREAAALDGASPWQTTRRVVLPLLGPTVRIWIFLSVIGSLQLFDLVWIMTLGGPAGASTTMATYLVDRGFRRYEFGYGSAVAVVLFLICFAFALVYQRFALRRDTEGALR
ncbi:carbohydrate ABC transporter permease [Kutzneria buriramensis]|uniref:Raffinose/stachyose/melibiose transport system permease protein n=1 Tax=Kutzneria buriramensis TaxID=1045776 RepID=A0A3E0GVB2_9PSEU|nr:sugar ABC transporter permease [Kutzneria buriramensis]REH29667.1 raffinose/stachyose/melibiose transport system permease protein [Kutzneria buriramensis]